MSDSTNGSNKAEPVAEPQYYVMSGAPHMLMEPEEGTRHIFRGPIDIGTAKTDTVLLGDVTFNASQGPHDISFNAGEDENNIIGFVTKQYGDMLYQEGAANNRVLGTIAPTQKGDFLQLVASPLGLKPEWTPFRAELFLPQDVSLYVRKATAQTIPRNQETVLREWTASEAGLYSTDGFDLEGGRFVAKKMGKHRVEALMTLQNESIAGATTVFVFLNGKHFAEQVFRAGASNLYPYSASISARPFLNVGDYIEIAVYHDSPKPIEVLNDVNTTLEICGSV